MGKFVVALLFAMLTLAVIVVVVDYEGDLCTISTFSFGYQGSCANSNCQCLESLECNDYSSGSQNRPRIPKYTDV